MAVNDKRLRRDVVVIGASAGGVTALRTLFSTLPPHFPASVGVVMHRSPVFESMLPSVLRGDSNHTILEPQHDERLERGRIYVAPRDQHMLFNDGRLQLNREPKQHHTRPAVDPMFQSAAKAYGPRVVGVVLTGGGDDGVSGLIAIKTTGGISIVQNPDEAQYPFMPNNAIAYDHVDLILPLRAVADVLVALAASQSVDVPWEWEPRRFR